jgi:hypothetical protein
MKYIAIDINGWLNGTVCRFLSKAEKSIWSDLLVLGGAGDGRLGFVEAAKGIAYSRQELLSLCHCFTDEDILAFDSCLKKCCDGVIKDGVTADEPRMKVENGIIEIVNWDTYQHSDYPKGYTEDEAKALKKKRKEAERSTDNLEIDKELNSAFASADLTKKALQINPHITRRVVTDFDKKKYGNASKAPKLDTDTGELKNGEKNE